MAACTALSCLAINRYIAVSLMQRVYTMLSFRVNISHLHLAVKLSLGSLLVLSMRSKLT